MPTNNGIVTGFASSGSSARVLAQVVNGNGQLAQQGDVSSIAWKVRDAATGALIDSGTLAVSTTIFNTPSMVTWTADAIGWNFRWVISGVDLSSPPGRKIDCRAYLTMADGSEEVVQVLIQLT